MSDDEASTDEQTVRHDRVGLAGGVQVLRHGPRRSVGVVRLNSSTTPRRVTVTVDEKVPVVGNDGGHHHVVDERTKDGTPDLGQEHDSR